MLEKHLRHLSASQIRRLGALQASQRYPTCVPDAEILFRRQTFSVESPFEEQEAEVDGPLWTLVLLF